MANEVPDILARIPPPDHASSRAPGFVLADSIPTKRVSDSSSLVRTEIGPNQVNKDLYISKQTHQDNIEHILVPLADGRLMDDEVPWYRLVSKLIQRKVHTSLAQQVIVQPVKVDGKERALFLSRKAAREFLDQSPSIMRFLPKAAREMLQKIATADFNYNSYPGISRNFPAEQLRGFTYELVEKISSFNEADNKKAVVTHEEIHIIQDTRHQGLKVKLAYLSLLIRNSVFSSTKYAEVSGPERTLARKLQKLEFELFALSEAEAMLHELFASRILDSQTLNPQQDFQIQRWHSRIANTFSLLLKYRSFPFETLLQRWQENNNTSEGEYLLGTLILLFSGKALNFNSDTLVDFSQVSSSVMRTSNSGGENLDTKRLCGVIVEKGLETCQQSTQFAQELLQSDVKSVILRKTREKELELGKLLVDIATNSPSLIPDTYTAAHFDNLKSSLSLLENEEY